MLTFAGSGLDSMLKQLVQDALPAVLDNHQGARSQFQKFVERRLRQNDEGHLARRFIADVLVAPDPRGHLVKRFVQELRSASLQSVEMIQKVGAAFDIESNVLVPDRNTLKEVFDARNQIVHELDVDFNDPESHRRTRQVDDMKTKTDALFAVSLRFLDQVNRRLPDE
ncbi:MAG: hypothetical protein OXP28_11400 [Gammaproteobacteria bacterium]|nr:hypothetical protein [Gammaproteobacteria bacterium]